MNQPTVSPSPQTPHPLHVAVIAAGGRSGKAVVTALLAAGHLVHAGVHTTRPNTITHGLIQLPCDATNPTDVSRLITGCDVVISLIGHVKGSSADVQTVATRTILACMKQAKIPRFISLSGTGIRQPGDEITLIDRFMNTSINLIDPARVKDGQTHATVLENSDVTFTLLRVLKLTNGPVKPFALTLHGPVATFTSRATVAAAIIEIMTNDTFKRASPMISRP